MRPYWEAFAAEAAAAAPEVRICFELHPGTCVYNVTTFERIADAGANLAVNLDPSHFFWQGIDPIKAIRELGDCIFHVHAKDTQIYDSNLPKTGVLVDNISVSLAQTLTASPRPTPADPCPTATARG